MVSAIGGGGYTFPSWQSASSDSASGLPTMPDWSDSSSGSPQDLGSYFADAASDISSVFSTAATNQLNGLVNNAADAAAKRLGVNLPSSSGSTGAASPSKPATKTPSAGAPTSAFTNIDQFLARLDGNPPPPVNPPGTTGGKFNLNSFLTGLDQITSGRSASTAPTTPSGKNFSIDSYLATIDSLTARPLSTFKTVA